MDLFSKAFFRKCDICQRNKTNFYDHCLFLVLYGPISPRILLIGYLILEVNPIIFVVVNRFSKYAHFIALKHSYSTMVVTQVFSFLFFFFFKKNHVFKLHGMPNSTRGPTSTSNFWHDVFRLQGLNFSSYHPQTNGQLSYIRGSTKLWRCTFDASQEI